MISAEMAPFAKVGGLADVAGALSQALAARGHDVRVVLPLYGHLDHKTEKIHQLKKLPPLSTRVGQNVQNFSVYMRGSASASVKVYLPRRFIGSATTNSATIQPAKYPMEYKKPS